MGAVPHLGGENLSGHGQKLFPLRPFPLEQEKESLDLNWSLEELSNLYPLSTSFFF